MAKLDPELQVLLAKKKYYDEHHGLYEKLPTSQKLEDPVNIAFTYKGSLSEIKVPAFSPSAGAGDVGYATVSLEVLQALANHPAMISIERLRRKSIGLDTSTHEILADQVWSRSGDNFSGFSGEGVVVGIIDTGIDYKHHGFKNANGTTRILKIWDQTIKPGAGEKSPDSFNDATLGGAVNITYGVEFNPGQINAGIRHKDTNSHGTHVTGIAAGNGSQSGNCHLSYHFIGVAPKADIIAVRMMGLTTGDDFTQLPPGTKSVMTDAIKYIIHEAKKILKPVVINMSLGTFTDEMNGLSAEAKEMDKILTGNPSGVALVLISGNDGASNFHAKADVPAAGILPIKFTVQPGDTQTRNIVILYTGANVSIQLTSHLGAPNGLIPWIAPTDPFVHNPKPGANGTNGEVNISHDTTNPTSRIAIEIVPPPGGVNIAGDWTIELKTTNGVATAVNALILYGTNNNRSSPKFLDHISSQLTLWQECTGNNVIAVGSYNDEGGALASSSGRGLTLDLRMKPEITAPGVGILSAASNDAASSEGGDYRGCCCDCCQDFYTTKSGTSMAAPHVTGVVALMLQKNKTLGFTDIKGKLVGTARPAPGDAPPDDVAGWGTGKVSAKAAVDGIAAVAAPAIGGGADGGPDHFKAAPKTEMQNLQERFLNTYRGKRLKGLLRPFFLEIRTLINTNKKIATVWHRSKGPAWMSAALRAASQPGEPVPQRIEGFSLPESAHGVATILKKYCSPLLVAHLEECEDEIRRLKEGMSVYELIALLEEPAFNPA